MLLRKAVLQTSEWQYYRYCNMHFHEFMHLFCMQNQHKNQLSVQYAYNFTHVECKGCMLTLVDEESRHAARIDMSAMSLRNAKTRNGRTHKSIHVTNAKCTQNIKSQYNPLLLLFMFLKTIFFLSFREYVVMLCVWMHFIHERWCFKHELTYSQAYD